jgi:hypothetical protein
MTRRQIPPSTTPKKPALSAAEQTKLSWAQFIGSYAAVPKVFQGFFEPLLAEGRAFPYAVLTPSYEGFLHRATEKLICDLGHEINILERRGQGFELQSYPLEQISCVEVTAILLDTRVKISGVTRQGPPASSTFKFNSVTDYLFTPILENIRLGKIDSRDEVLSSELEKFDHWAGVNYKFMNFAKHSLVGGEKVIQAVLQAEIRAGEFTLMGRTFYRRISPTHITILTDRELIVVREEGSKGGVDRYGGTWHYIPLKEVVALSMGRKGTLLALSIQLPQDARIERLFQASAKREIDQLLDRFRELT